MAAGFLVVLVLAWVVIYLPAASRIRGREPLKSAETFKRGLEVIGPAGPKPAKKESLASSLPVRVLPARAALFAVLLTLALGSSVIAALKGGELWELHLAADACLALFVAWLLEEKHQRRKRVRDLRMTRAAGQRTRAA